MGAASELREVFVNLILNAVQAMPEGGTITFDTYTSEQQAVCARVTDTGIGMSDDIQENIFEPLFTTKGEQGTGMGLAASYGIVQEHEGEIDVSSTPGEGTEFILSFPPVQRGASNPETDDSTETHGQSIQILVVDDEDMVRSIADQLLTLNGHNVTCAQSGPEALSLLSETAFDI